MTAPLACWRCELPGHGYTDCQRPPARTPAELDQRLNRLLERWDAGHGELRTSLKTAIAAIEIASYRKEKARKA